MELQGRGVLLLRRALQPVHLVRRLQGVPLRRLLMCAGRQVPNLQGARATATVPDFVQPLGTTLLPPNIFTTVSTAGRSAGQQNAGKSVCTWGALREALPRSLGASPIFALPTWRIQACVAPSAYKSGRRCPHTRQCPPGTFGTLLGIPDAASLHGLCKSNKSNRYPELTRVPRTSRETTCPRPQPL